MNGARTILRRKGANDTKSGLMVQRDGVVDALPLEIIEPKARLNSSSLDCNESNS
jgi:hypothetical protein